MGYSCSFADSSGLIIHHSKGGPLPGNPCTSGTKNTMNIPEDQMLHWALQGKSIKGYLSLAFPEVAKAMYPAKTVIGWQDPTSGAPDVKAYTISSYDISPSDATPDFATNMGFVSQGSTTTLCFSVPQAAISTLQGGSVGHRRLQATSSSEVNLNWAISSSPSLVMHDDHGSLSLTPGTAVPVAVVASSSSSSGGKDLAFRLAHGVLMTLAFVLLMPGGVLLARHKWMFGDAKTGCPKPSWFHLHRSSQVLALVLAVVGFIIIWVQFQWGNRAATSNLYPAHRWLGIIAMFMVVVQAVLGSVRPALGPSSARKSWLLAKQIWGWLAISVGVVAVLLGIVLMRDLSSIGLAAWMIPVVVVLGVVAAAGLVLEIRRRKLVREGRYNPITHAFTMGADYPQGGHSFVDDDPRGANTQKMILSSNGGSAAARGGLGTV